MFNKIEIQNFRAIKELEVEDLGRINLFLGENNSSKTSILESLFLLIGFTNPELITRIHLFRDFILSEEDDLRFIFHNLDYENSITIKASSNEKEFRTIEIKPSSSTNSNIQQSKVDLKNVSYDSSKESPTINELSLKAEIKEKHASKRSANSKLTFTNGDFNLNQPKNFKDDLRGVYITPNIPLPNNLQKELEKQLINKQHDELIKILKLIDPRIEKILFGSSSGMIYVDVGLNRLMPLNLLGDGIKRLLSIILAISSSRNGIVLIDELENGMHYSTLKKVWNTIIGLSKSYDVQLFITTHNVETLRALQEVLSEEQKDFQKDVRSYTIRKLSDKHKAYKYDFETFENSILEGVEIR